MSCLTSSTLASWSGRLDVGEGVLELALPRGVGPERVALGGLPGGVQLDQLGRDLLDGLAGAALALVPVGAAEAVERRVLAADVAGDLVELVGRHEQPVGRVAALGGGVLDQEVLAGRALDLALDHLDVAADAVLLVHDEVAGARARAGRSACVAATASAASPWRWCAAR